MHFSIEDCKNLESFITHVEEVVTLSEIFVSDDESQTKLGDRCDITIVEEICIDKSKSILEDSLKFSHSEDEILLDIGKLFEITRETSVHDFPGFNSPVLKRSEFT